MAESTRWRPSVASFVIFSAAGHIALKVPQLQHHCTLTFLGEAYSAVPHKILGCVNYASGLPATIRIETLMGRVEQHSCLFGGPRLRHLFFSQQRDTSHSKYLRCSSITFQGANYSVVVRRLLGCGNYASGLPAAIGIETLVGSVEWQCHPFGATQLRHLLFSQQCV